MLSPLPPLASGSREARATYLLAAAGVIVFALGAALPGLTPAAPAAMRGIPPELLRRLPPGAIPDASPTYTVWMMLAGLFMSPSVIDAVLGTAILIYFGRDVERQLGLSRFLLLYFLGAVLGLGVQLATSSFTLAAGTAGAIAVLLVYARLWPLNRVSVFGVAAVGARELLMVGVGYRLLWRMGLGGSGDLLAALGGLAGGAIFCAWLEHTSAGSDYRRRVRSALVGDAKSWNEIDWDAIPRDGLHPLNLEELDRIADKARTSGVKSLTDDERAFVHRLRLRE